VVTGAIVKVVAKMAVGEVVGKKKFDSLERRKERISLVWVDSTNQEWTSEPITQANQIWNILPLSAHITCD
jgi:hypothetical protein